MKNLFLLDDAIISPLGLTTEENFASIKKGVTGLTLHKNKRFPNKIFYAGILETDILHQAFQTIGNPANFTKLEQMMLLAVHKIIVANPGLNINETALILSTTKGNIDALEETSPFPKIRVYLTELARVIKDFFGFTKEPVIISNACISGGLALVVAKRLISADKHEQAIVVAGDLVSEFVISGFNSFHAISGMPCAPFAKNRNGISLGEAAAAILVSSRQPKTTSVVSLVGESTANDANHISGPSRNGDGLVISIKKAIKEAGISGDEISYISAHGTGTVYNDEMESVALNRLNLSRVPLNSFKGYYGHTLGAAALLESILTKHSLLNNELLTSVNYGEHGVTFPLNVITVNRKEFLKYGLKIASGFGGCNIALVFKKKVNVA